MNIEGTYTLQATPAEVWHYLTDQDTLSGTLPGVKHISPIAKDMYDITVSMDSAPFTGSHHGQITISEQHYPHQFNLTATSDGKTNLHGVGNIHLHDREGKTIVAYEGTFTFNKTGTHLAPALIKGAIKLYMQQYFQSLAEHLHDNQLPQFAQELNAAASTITKQTTGDIIAIPHPVAVTKHARTETIISKANRLFHPTAGDPQLQARWKQRIRRTGTITGLLLLVWIGTKIPRRQP
jgi:carbon monoxide dehydrogenase subunit G